MKQSIDSIIFIQFEFAHGNYITIFNGNTGETTRWRIVKPTTFDAEKLLISDTTVNHTSYLQLKCTVEHQISSGN